MGIKVLNLSVALLFLSFLAPVFGSEALRNIGAKKYATYKAHMINFRRFEYFNSFPQTRNLDIYCDSAKSALEILVAYGNYLEEAMPGVDFKNDMKQLVAVEKRC